MARRRGRRLQPERYELRTVRRGHRWMVRVWLDAGGHVNYQIRNRSVELTLPERAEAISAVMHLGRGRIGLLDAQVMLFG